MGSIKGRPATSGSLKAGEDSARAREMAAKSHEVQRKKKSARELMELALDMVQRNPKSGEEKTLKEIIIERVAYMAAKGDLKAAMYVLELIGEGPVKRTEASVSTSGEGVVSVIIDSFRSFSTGEVPDQATEEREGD